MDGGTPGWKPQPSGPPADQIDPLAEEAYYQGVGNMLAGLIVSVGLVVMVTATLWVQPSLEPAERLVGSELWAVVVGCAVVSMGAHILFTRPLVHVKDGTFKLLGAVRELSFPVRDIADVGTRLGYAYVRLRSGQRIVILGLEAAPVRIDAELECFLRDFKAVLPAPNSQLEQPAPEQGDVAVRWRLFSWGLGLLLIVWVIVALVAQHQTSTIG